MKKAFIYCRVSTSEQAEEGKSIETQEKVCQRWANDNGYTVLEVFKDEGKSATNLNRPALKNMLAQCEMETVSAILVMDTDRLCRNTLDHLTIKAILKKKNINVISFNQPMLDDSPEGNLMDTMIASFSAFQSQITGRKTSKVLEEKAKMGWYPGGLPPLGYKNIENPNPISTLDKQIIGIDPVTSPYVLKIFEMYSTGNYSIYDLAGYLNKKGLRSQRRYKIHGSLVAHKLKDIFYIGEFIWNHQIYRGKHELFIPRELFMQVQKVMQAHNQNATRKRKHNFLLRGFLTCANCGRRILGELHTKKNGYTYSFYFCPSCKKDTYIARDKLEKQVEHVFKKIEVSDDYVNSVMERAKTLLEESRTSEESEKRRITKSKFEIEKAMQEAEDSRFRTHTLSEEAFQRIYPRYETQLKDIQEELNELQKDHSKNIDILEKVLQLAEDIGNSYEKADFIQKRNYLGLFFKNFKVKNGKIIKFSLAEDLKTLIENGSVRLRNNGLPD